MTGKRKEELKIGRMNKKIENEKWKEELRK
jgi:hypothetical protein